ncbi:hypothetical protein ED733_004367 [Metarhizium rileyi]|uniref:Uncharacterized protein n=1 Tax=Metarhizium rileyi (strain RCEF 4871) TaxID=1649241 RepID=A0A5C6G7D8_METRR|nr:hypothetical protein ED733_004367 [Metarhizium rileyi]
MKYVWALKTPKLRGSRTEYIHWMQDTAIDQITTTLKTDDAATKIGSIDDEKGAGRVRDEYERLQASIQERANRSDDGSFEAVKNASLVHDNIQPTIPDSWINCGGAELGIKLATEAKNAGRGTLLATGR